MLTPEEAQKRLEQLHIADVTLSQLRAIAKLPENLRVPAYALLRCDAEGKRYTEYYYIEEVIPFFADAVSRLASLSNAERVRIFEIFFPKMAKHVEQAWHLANRLPYTYSSARRPFRAHKPEVTMWKAWNWLEGFVNVASEYHQDLLWFAQYAGYIRNGWASTHFGILFAAVLDSDDATGDELFALLIASARGEDAIGIMGRHIPRALLTASRLQGWEFMEALLLSAQREEGLRQIILEIVDEAHPVAFQRMVQLILTHNLTRFSAVVRAVDVWFGLAWDSEAGRVVTKTLTQVLAFLQEDEARQTALANAEGETLYLALWSIAYSDALAAVEAAIPLLQDGDVGRRYATVTLLVQLQLNEARRALVPALRDGDLRVVAQACDAFVGRRAHMLPLDLNLFEEIEAVLARLPKKKSFEPLVWEWAKAEAHPERIATILLNSLDQRSPKRLIPHLEQFDGFGRVAVAKRLVEVGFSDPVVRDTLFKLVGDRAANVREDVLRLLEGQSITAQEALYLEGLLTRKASDLRRGILSLLAKQADKAALASADRLLAARAIEQRTAGLEVLTQLVAEQRVLNECHQRASSYRADHTNLTLPETNFIDKILDYQESPFTLDDVLGLINPADRTRPTPPTPPTPPIVAEGQMTDKGKSIPFTAASKAGLLALDDFIHEHRTTPLWVQRWNGEREELLLGDVDWRFPFPKPDAPIEEEIHLLPLRELWEGWLMERPAALRDADGLELVRMWLRLAYGLANQNSSYFLAPELRHMGVEKLKYPAVMTRLMHWLIRLAPVVPATRTTEFLLDCAQSAMADLHQEAVASTRTSPVAKLIGVAVSHLTGRQTNSPRSYSITKLRSHAMLHNMALEVARLYRDTPGIEWTPPQYARLWQMDRWIDEPVAGKRRSRPLLQDLLEAHRVGAATDADLYDQILGPAVGLDYDVDKDVEEAKAERVPELRFLSFVDKHEPVYALRWLTTRRPNPLLVEFPPLAEVVERCRRRILEVELARGELPTVVTTHALALQSVEGAHWFVRILQAMSSASFERGYLHTGENRNVVLSHLLRVSFPAAADSDALFTELVQAAKISPQRLVEAAVYAPQWVEYVAAVIGWKGFVDAVWWVHAHTKDANWFVAQEIRDLWQAQTIERTALSGEELVAGAVDVAWFWRTYQTMGAERWEMVYDAAKYSSGGQGHTRAKLFAEAMLGQVDEKALVKRIQEKRHQDSVRALGLLPLPAKDGEVAEGEILHRYQVMQEFARGAQKFGAQRQEAERRATQIGLENLARTAGYVDPMRLQWAMEAQEVADLRHGPLALTVQGVTVTLRLDEVGAPQLEFEKGNKPLKAMPAALKKIPEVVALRERKSAIDKQRARMKLSLEHAMCDGDSFTPPEVATLLTHPVLAPLLEDLVFTDEERLGYVVKEGRALQGYDGSTTPLAQEARLRIAHPYDLYQGGDWHLWQQECFAAERIQPFKQLFRELYLLTAAEEADGTISRRYAGHQVQPRQALALLGKRRWVTRPEEGVQRAFQRYGFSAYLTFLEGFYTPAEVEGLTLEGVVFMPSGRWRHPLRLTEIPPLIFSEVMRDLDLVVSVAHRGGIDPESSASTVEMRAMLVRESCALLKLENVTVQGRHALIEGKLGSYSVHLGSGVVHRQPGGALCIIPVHAAHRGRLFLPFADDDPKTAEVVSKVLLLARDKEIRDPSILEQIVARA